MPTNLLTLQVHAASSSIQPTNLGTRDHLNQAKYIDLLARYYVLKRQHLLAARVLFRLAEMRSVDGRDAPTLEERLVLASGTRRRHSLKA